MFDYKLIEALAMVIKEGGFDRAAKTLYITQSAVSQRVKMLEEMTGQVLIVRSTPPKATPAGRKLLKHYLKVQQLENDLAGEMEILDSRGFISLSIGINADSLALWFLEVMTLFLIEERVLLDIQVNDQEQTHQSLKDGDVIGCISTKDQPMQGCRIQYIGQMSYRLVASPQFAARWFPNGITAEDIRQAPAVIFNRQDELHDTFIHKIFNRVISPIPVHYLPSVEKFADFIIQGLAYGMMPDQQSASLLNSGQLINLFPDKHLPVNLYWHCWNLKSKSLDKLTQHLTCGAGKILTLPI